MWWENAASLLFIHIFELNLQIDPYNRHHASHVYNKINYNPGKSKPESRVQVRSCLCVSQSPSLNTYSWESRIRLRVQTFESPNPSPESFRVK